MIRPAANAVVLLIALVGCASTRTIAPSSAPDRDHTAFSTEEQRLVACLDLQDHIVDLYADEYVSTQGLSLNPVERVAFRDGWAEELAKRGTFERFEQSCFLGVTPRKYECGMQSHSTGGLVACMKLSER
jgi:hypothetical protein